jgi:hypothetical protein
MEPRATQEELAAIDREIRNLIASEDNHKDKGMLLLMQSINRNLTENTFATIRAAQGIEVVNTKVDGHVVEFQAWKNTGFGAYRSGMLFIGVIQVLSTAALGVLGWATMTHLKQNDEDHVLVAAMSQMITSVQQRTTYLDSRVDNLTSVIIDIVKTHRDDKGSK